jgi:hypothetical protein
VLVILIIAVEIAVAVGVIYVGRAIRRARQDARLREGKAREPSLGLRVHSRTLGQTDVPLPGLSSEAWRKTRSSVRFAMTISKRLLSCR